jgi:exopolysaccharide production repressor protein
MRGETLMSFLLFFRGLIGALFVFAVTTYFVTRSIPTTLVDTLICGVLIQLGYFIAVLFLVWRTPTPQAGNDGTARDERTRPNVAGKPARSLSNTSRSRHS